MLAVPSQAVQEATLITASVDLTASHTSAAETSAAMAAAKAIAH
jgi:hypothetical protein